MGADASEMDGREDGLAARVDSGCARILRGNAVPSVLTNIVLSCLVAAVAWMHGHEMPAIAWLAAGMVINVIRLGVAKGFDLAADLEADKVRAWSRRYCWAAFLSGCVWGTVGFLFIFRISRTRRCFSS